MRSITSYSIRRVSLRVLLLFAIFIAALLVFWFIADEMVLEQENNLDKTVFDLLTPYVNPVTTRLMLFLTFFGSSYFLFPAYILLILYFLIFKKNWRLSFDVAAIGITSTIILFSIKSVFHRNRPYDPLVRHVPGFSFPSGHSFSSFTFCGLLIYIIWNQPYSTASKWILSVLLFLFAASIAISRVYLRVHYASDVVAGFSLCLVWLILSFWVLKRFFLKKEQKMEPLHQTHA